MAVYSINVMVYTKSQDGASCDPVIGIPVIVI